MDDIEFFISNFIEKDRQNRWRTFLKKDFYKFKDELHKIEKSLNNKCILFEKNSDEIFETITKKKNIEYGTYVDFDGVHEKYSINNELIYNDNLYIVSDKNIAFVLYHEGYIYVCEK